MVSNTRVAATSDQTERQRKIGFVRLRLHLSASAKSLSSNRCRTAEDDGDEVDNNRDYRPKWQRPPSPSASSVASCHWIWIWKHLLNQFLPSFLPSFPAIAYRRREEAGTLTEESSRKTRRVKERERESATDIGSEE